jgi:hypothetical protein
MPEIPHGSDLNMPLLKSRAYYRPIESVKFPNQVPIFPRLIVGTIPKDPPHFAKIVAACHHNPGSLGLNGTDASNDKNNHSRARQPFLSLAISIDTRNRTKKI